MKAIHLTVVLAGLCLTTFDLQAQTDGALTNGLVAYYPLMANANDESGHGNNGSMQAATGAVANSTNAFGKSGLYFDGLHRVDVPDASSLDPTGAISVSAWFNADDWSGNRRILQKGNMQYQFCAEYGFFDFALSGTVANNSLRASLPSTGAWHHAVGTYDGETMTIYMDGALAAKQAARGWIAKSYPSGHPSGRLNIGGKPASSDLIDFFKGSIRNVRIYIRALSSQEVAALYAAESRSHQE
jgi:hypothetical protein